jgi:hypothetical protein
VGWKDSYGWSLDCSWLDITDLDPGTYVLEITANPDRVFPEVTSDNNVGMAIVTIPDIGEEVAAPLKLKADIFKPGDKNTNTTEKSSTSSASSFNTGVVQLLTMFSIIAKLIEKTLV